MIMEKHRLVQPLDSFIESIFHFKHFKPDHSIERVVPTGHIFIIFELDGFERYTYDNETLKPNNQFTKVWVSGQHKNYISISAHEDSEMFVIQFKHHGGYPFFHFPMEELNEKVVPGESLFGDEILDLRKQLQSSETSQEKFKSAENWLLERMDMDKTPPIALSSTIELLQQKPAGQFQEIVNQYPNSQKHLINQFKKFVGLTPKYFHRILRFNEILTENLQ